VREYSASSKLLDIPVTSAVLGNISSSREAIKTILHKTLDKDPSKRGSAREIRLHLTFALIFTSSKAENRPDHHDDGVHEPIEDESVRGTTTEYSGDANSRKRR
jgi:serine/threonine protein kinase